PPRLLRRPARRAVALLPLRPARPGAPRIVGPLTPPPAGCARRRRPARPPARPAPLARRAGRAGQRPLRRPLPCAPVPAGEVSGTLEPVAALYGRGAVDRRGGGRGRCPQEPAS